mmetsp:Transcript_287/g.474  ORF Transcript_287/g.474 Transcript_287/m.474 type:complete len:316 (-) Transcript_287:168-1115(-)
MSIKITIVMHCNFELITHYISRKCNKALVYFSSSFSPLMSFQPNVTIIATVAAMAPVFPAFTRILIMIPAKSTPALIAEADSLNPMPSRKAPMAPVQAPVPGRGMPTNRATARDRFFSDPRPLDFSAARSNTGFITFCMVLFLRAASRGMMGIRFPTTHRASTFSRGRPIHWPTGMPPLSSTTGMALMIISTTSSGSPVLRNWFAIFWPRWRCSSADTAVLRASAALAERGFTATAAIITKAAVTAIFTAGFLNTPVQRDWCGVGTDSCPTAPIEKVEPDPSRLPKKSFKGDCLIRLLPISRLLLWPCTGIFALE